MFGSELVIQALARRGVRTIFSLSGNQIMPLYDACIDVGIRIVHVRHEAAAVFMADAWAQVTGEIGVVMLTAGPGIANGVGPLYSASEAESPVLLLSGDSALAEDGSGAFQEMDQVAMTRPLTKLSQRATALDQLDTLIAEAIDTALAPRRGPVHIVLPFDLLTSNAPTAPSEPERRLSLPETAEPETLLLLADLISRAKRPLILAGPSACRAADHKAWQELATRLQVPVVPMESPRGLRDPALGVAGGEISKADLVIFAGKRLDFTTGFGKGKVFDEQARFVVIDPESALIERAQRLLGTRLVCAQRGDPAVLLAALSRSAAPIPRTQWMQDVGRAMASRSSAPHLAPTSQITSRQLCEQVQRFIERAENVILVCDGGEFGQWAQAFCHAPVRIINGTSGAIGGGLCFAIAAKIARPDATVVALMGDGTSGFHFMEFDTAVRENAPFVAVIGNDLRWNAEHLIQLREYGEKRLVGCSLAESARYNDVTRALGGFGVLVSEGDAIDAALREAAASQKPACVNVLIDSQPAPVFAAAATSVH